MISDLAEPPPPSRVIHQHRPTPSHSVMSKAESSTNQPTKEDTIPGLGVLEEDDEFEEFPVQGTHADPSMKRLS